MARLSLYKPEKGLDYKFMDRQASEMFTVGGTDVFIHKYLGVNTDSANATADQPHYATTAVTNIQDLLFLENRDRTYDTEIYRIRGIYNVQNIDFNVSQFGLFIDNDTIYMTVHINDIQNILGRKPISGDVFELPHLKDDFALNGLMMGMPRYYAVADVGRASEGFSSTWYPHLYRIKLTKVTDSQQFASILEQPATDANGDPSTDGTTLKELLSTFNQEIAVNAQVVAQAEADAPMSGYETRQFYTLAVDPTTGKAVLETADDTELDASSTSANINAAAVNGIPVRSGYSGYLLGDGYPVNGYTFGFGIQFPSAPETNDFFLRTDFLPNRLFRFDGKGWSKVEDAVRMNMTNNDTRATQKTGFINNTAYTYFDQIGSDTVNLAANATVVNSRIDFSTGSTAAYVVLKYQTTQLEFAVSDYTGLITSYSYTSPSNVTSDKVRINLPIINTVQQEIPNAGIWSVALYDTRVEQRQSLSTALKPRADF